MPRKVFVPGERAFANDVNEFLMNQAVMTFADATERTAAIPAPVEGMLTYRADGKIFEGWNGSSWVSVASI